MDDLTRRVLALVAEPDYQPTTLKAMAKRFKVGDDGYAELRSAIKALVKSGQLELAKDKSLRKAEVKSGSVVGTFRRSSKGFGFVRPAGGSGDALEAVAGGARVGVHVGHGPTLGATGEYAQQAGDRVLRR